MRSLYLLFILTYNFIKCFVWIIQSVKKPFHFDKRHVHLRLGIPSAMRQPAPAWQQGCVILQPQHTIKLMNTFNTVSSCTDVWNAWWNCDGKSWENFIAQYRCCAVSKITFVVEYFCVQWFNFWKLNFLWDKYFNSAKVWLFVC